MERSEKKHMKYLLKAIEMGVKESDFDCIRSHLEDFAYYFQQMEEKWKTQII